VFLGGARRLELSPCNTTSFRPIIILYYSMHVRRRGVSTAPQQRLQSSPVVHDVLVSNLVTDGSHRMSTWMMAPAPVELAPKPLAPELALQKYQGPEPLNSAQRSAGPRVKPRWPARSLSVAETSSPSSTASHPPWASVRDRAAGMQEQFVLTPRALPASPPHPARPPPTAAAAGRTGTPRCPLQSACQKPVPPQGAQRQ